MTFDSTMAIIESDFEYLASRLIIGDVNNEPGVNEGSCKILRCRSRDRMRPNITEQREPLCLLVATPRLLLVFDLAAKPLLSSPLSLTHTRLGSFARLTGLDVEDKALTLNLFRRLLPQRRVGQPGR